MYTSVLKLRQELLNSLILFSILVFQFSRSRLGLVDGTVFVGLEDVTMFEKLVIVEGSTALCTLLVELLSVKDD